MRICIFCGSSRGNDERYALAARDIGTTFAARAIELVYGGGRVGLMGVVADAVLSAGGVAIGVIPQALADREIQHTGLSELHVVATMHERKTKMAALADGFIALPGGAGTLEEILEQWTWAQIGLHHKPCGFLNVNGYFDPLRTMIDQMVSQGFLRPEYASMIFFEQEPAALLERFSKYSAPLAKWELPQRAPAQQTIRIVTALVQDEHRRVLLVRKRGTRAFMQPGGKLRSSESHLAALEREIREELSCSVRPNSPEFLGTFSAPAANESGCFIEAALYRVELAGTITACAEIDEVLWVDPDRNASVELAPLTRDSVLPLARLPLADVPPARPSLR